MAKRIAAAIKHTLKVCKKTPISMKWREDPSKENQGLGEAKKWNWRRKRFNQKPE
jgi:hypothetical protein